MREPLATHLGEILADEARHFQRLLELLRQEQSALRGADVGGVMQALREQEGTLAMLRALEGQRIGVVAALAGSLEVAPAELTLSRVLEAVPGAAGRLAAVRDELQAVLAAVRRANEFNGVLARRGLGYLDRLITHLTSALAPERSPAYSARGRTSPGAASLGLVDRRA
jgi:flagellar biosynthesis/type III secretory pathway chaperone